MVRRSVAIAAAPAVALRRRNRGHIDGCMDVRLTGLCGGYRVNTGWPQATSQLSESVITLKGSTELVTEFFAYSINRCAIPAHSRAL